MKSSKRMIALFLVVVFAFTFAFAFHTNSAKAAGPIQLEFWNGFTGPDGKGIAKLVDIFNQKYQGKIQVKMQVMQWGAYYDKIVTAVVSGKAPDIGIMHLDSIAKYANKGILLPLDEFASKLKLSENDFIPVVWKAGIINGKRYGIPLDVHPLALYYNVDLLKQAGYDHPPANREEFLDLAKKCTKDTDGDGKIDQWGFAMPPGWPSSQIYWAYLHQFGGKAFDDYLKITKPLFNSKEGIEALQFLVDTIFKYKISPANIQQDGEVTLFKQGKLAMQLNGIWMIQGYKEQKGLNFMTAPVPQIGPKKATWAGSHNFVVFKKKDFNSKKDAIFKFIDFISRNSFEWAKAGQVPARNSVRFSKAFATLKEQYEIAKQADYIVFPPMSPISGDVMGPLGEAVNLAVLGKKTPKQALDEAAVKVEKIIKQNR
ncbi:ABC transporter substrate-binding protein [Caldicellulosiruptoraceae bacterium PP1]